MMSRQPENLQLALPFPFIFDPHTYTRGRLCHSNGGQDTSPLATLKKPHRLQILYNTPSPNNLYFVAIQYDGGCTTEQHFSTLVPHCNTLHSWGGKVQYCTVISLSANSGTVNPYTVQGWAT